MSGDFSTPFIPYPRHHMRYFGGDFSTTHFKIYKLKTENRKQKLKTEN